MNSEWPREVRRRADGAGVVYELPVRPLGGRRWIGLGPIAFSLLFVSGPARGLIGTVQRLLRDDIQPTLRSARQTVDSIRGTTSFVADTAVAPVIRVYGIFSGVRRFLSVLLGFKKRKSR